VELLRSLGLAYSNMEKDHGLILPVIEANCRYRGPARYDDQILIETRPSLVKGSVIKFGYRILRKNAVDENAVLLAEGETVHVVCDAEFKRAPLPVQYATALKSLMD
jgi:acyl-CoA thioester hydrolase